jgi:hypothetical protein
MLVTILLVLLLIVMIFMAIRDGRPFFADALKTTALIIALLLAIATWFPLLHR